jgi:hypothetical protein
MTTVRKNSQEYKQAFARAGHIKAFTLENCFNGEPAKAIPEYAKDMGKLIKRMDGYSLRVHSNLWYEWSVV